MEVKSFAHRLRARQSQAKSVLCVGLDPDLERLPPSFQGETSVENAIVDFNREIIAATAQFACAFKLNFAFYEVHGAPGWNALEKTLELIPAEVLTIADGKRGDIGNTARFYAKSVFDSLGFDACTVAPYMGTDAIGPFLERRDKGAFLLCRTSNASADDLQLLGGGDNSREEPLYERVARLSNAWNDEYPGTLGLVVGATRPEDLRRVRSISPTLPFLVPGVGAQGGDPRATVNAAQTPEGIVLVNSSRSILYAESGPDFAEAAGEAADSLRRKLSLETTDSDS
ncbi:MAG: orotidine-5'-phosphate decarboxylase [Rhodothermales bacterium]|nr:orotidine-5'-phosphate decarboxylase [Rhodothermales bacterium]